MEEIQNLKNEILQETDCDIFEKKSKIIFDLIDFFKNKLKKLDSDKDNETISNFSFLSNSDSDDISDYADDDKVDFHEYRKCLSKLFPSKHINKKIKAGERLKKCIEDNKTKISKNNLIISVILLNLIMDGNAKKLCKNLLIKLRFLI